MRFAADCQLESLTKPATLRALAHLLRSLALCGQPFQVVKQRGKFRWRQAGNESLRHERKLPLLAFRDSANRNSLFFCGNGADGDSIGGFLNDKPINLRAVVQLEVMRGEVQFASSRWGERPREPARQ